MTCQIKQNFNPRKQIRRLRRHTQKQGEYSSDVYSLNFPKEFLYILNWEKGDNIKMTVTDDEKHIILSRI